MTLAKLALGTAQFGLDFLGTAVDAAGATLRIFDIRGSLVRTLRGGRLANDRLAIPWDGTDGNGRVATPPSSVFTAPRRGSRHAVT